MNGRTFPASRSLVGLGRSSSATLTFCSFMRSCSATSSAIRRSISASDSRVRGRNTSVPVGGSRRAILTFCWTRAATTSGSLSCALQTQTKEDKCTVVLIKTLTSHHVFGVVAVLISPMIKRGENVCCLWLKPNRILTGPLH